MEPRDAIVAVAALAQETRLRVFGRLARAAGLPTGRIG
jgi:hypothetical protein